MDSNDLMELGLTKTCSHFTVEQEPSGETYKVFCRRPTLEFGGVCARHDPRAELIRQGKLESRKVVMEQKRKLEEEVLPKATERIEGILQNEEAKDADVIKIWQTTMDRVGLAATQHVQVEGEIKVEAPLDILRRMLTAPTVMLEEITDAEIVGEITDGS